MTSTQQAQLAARIVRHHHCEYGGDLGTLGTITGYRLQRTFDRTVLLNTDGTIQEGFNRATESPLSTLTIKGKRVPMGMFTAG